MHDDEAKYEVSSGVVGNPARNQDERLTHQPLRALGSSEGPHRFEA